MTTNLKLKSINAVKWNSIGQISNTIIRFSFGVYLARLLSPEDFGLVALVTVITDISVVFIESGFSSGIIQREKSSPEDYSSIFYFNIFLGLFFTLFFFLAADYIAIFYNDVRIENITKVVSFVYLINSLSIVPNAVLAKELQFKKQTLLKLIGTITSSIFGIILALNGFEFWTLIWKRVFEAMFTTTIFLIFAGWYPKLNFKFEIIKKYWDYSSKILFTRLFSFISNQFDLFFVGKIFHAKELGFFSRGKNYAFLPVIFSSTVISKSFFPVFAKIQNDQTKFDLNFIKIYRMIVYTLLPVFGLIILNSNDLIILVIGSKWAKSSEYLRLFSFVGIFYILNSFRVNLISAKGFPEYNLRYGIISGILKIATLVLFTLYFKNLSPVIYVYIILAFFIISFFFQSYFMSKITNISFQKNIFIVYKEIILNLVIAYLLHFTIVFFNFQMLSGILVTVPLYIAIYLIVSYLFKFTPFIEIMKLYKDYRYSNSTIS